MPSVNSRVFSYYEFRLVSLFRYVLFQFHPFNEKNSSEPDSLILIGNLTISAGTRYL